MCVWLNAHNFFVSIVTTSVYTSYSRQGGNQCYDANNAASVAFSNADLSTQGGETYSLSPCLQYCATSFPSYQYVGWTDKSDGWVAVSCLINYTVGCEANGRSSFVYFRSPVCFCAVCSISNSLYPHTWILNFSLVFISVLLRLVPLCPAVFSQYTPLVLFFWICVFSLWL